MTMFSERRRSVKRSLMRLLDNPALDPEMVAAVAGDRPLSAEEKRQYSHIRRRRGRNIYCDLLFALTHVYFPEDEAKAVWGEILDHKDRLTESLGRNPGVSVAVHDYLINVRQALKSLVLIPAERMTLLAEVALKDGLTELYDSGSFQTFLEREMKRFKRYGTTLSLILLDLDNFKRFNDTRGHPEGDRLLKRLGAVIRQNCREMDVAARIGGEEFALLLPHTDVAQAEVIAQRLRRSIEKTFAEDFQTTASLGVAACPEHAREGDDLIRKADDAMYDAKHAGKNRVCVWNEC